jgi:hypothetical protein
LLVLQKLSDVLGAAVVVLVVIERFPRGKVLRILRTRDGSGIARLQGIAGQSVKIIILLARRYQFWRVGVIVNGFDLVDFGEQLRIGGLRHGAAWEEREQQAERGQKTLAHEATPFDFPEKHSAKE